MEDNKFKFSNRLIFKVYPDYNTLSKKDKWILLNKLDAWVMNEKTGIESKDDNN